MALKLCGEDNLAHMAIVTTMWDEVDKKTAAAREKQLTADDLFFKAVITKGARTFRHNNTAKAARAVLSYLVKKRQTSLRIQEELVDKKIDITQTLVGRELQSEATALIQRHNTELAELQGEMATAINARDTTARQELEEARKELEGKIHALEGDGGQLADGYALAKRNADRLISQLPEASYRPHSTATASKDPHDMDVETHKGSCCTIM